MEVFEYRDREGDSLEVRTYGDRELRLNATAVMYLDTPTVVLLRDALTQWLGGDVPLTPADVRALVTQTIAEVLPLHLSPQARYVDAHPADPDAPAYCQIDGCTLPSYPGAVHFEHDPEPHDVGHPDTVDAALADPLPSWSDKLFGKERAPLVCDLPLKPGQTLADPCSACGYVWALHPHPPKQLVWCECGHRWLAHGREGCQTTFGVSNARCTCPRTPQDVA